MECYLDNSATTPVCAEAAEAVSDALLHNWGNPSSLYRKGMQAEDVLLSAREALADLAASNLRSVRLDDVERVVQEVFGLESNALKSSSRAKKCADPRAVAMWIARKHTRAALAEIGNFFGGRKHSAVLSAQKKVDAWIETNETLDAAGAPISVNEAIERVERALSYPRQ